jgi:hypothetical protein
LKKTAHFGADPRCSDALKVKLIRPLAADGFGECHRLRSFRSVPPRFLRPLARVDTACFARSVCRPKMVLRPGRKCSVSQHALGSCDAAPSRVGGEVVRECERSRCQLRAALQQRAFGARVVYHAQFRTQSVTKHGLPCSGCLPYAIKSKCSFQNFEFPPIARTLPLDTF